MSTPKVIQDIRDIQDTYLFASDEQVEDHPELPIDATTLGGRPADHYASKEDVSQTLLSYIRTVLGTTY